MANHITDISNVPKISNKWVSSKQTPPKCSVGSNFSCNSCNKHYIMRSIASAIHGSSVCQSTHDKSYITKLKPLMQNVQATN